MPLRLFVFSGGHEIADKSMLTLGQDLGVPRKIPFQYFLVDHPKGRLMFDTGFNPVFLDRPQDYKPAVLFASQVQREDLAGERLAGMGLKPEDIQLVANSHLHYDHAGGNCTFRHATFLVQWDELQSAMTPEPFSGLVADNYARQDFDLDVHYELLDGDYDVFGDGAVRLIRTPGHTRGHQSLVVNLPETGVLVLAQDAVYLQENLDRMILATTCWDQKLMIQSYRRLRELQRLEQARIIPGHDIEVFAQMRLAPLFYA